MVQPNSRRSFLFGRQSTANDEWSRFVVRLRDACTGRVRLVTERHAHLDPARLDDVLQALKLCQTYGVVMALEGLSLPEADQPRFVLWVQAGSRWGTLMPLGDTGLWRVDAGCAVAGLQGAGLIDALGAGQSLNFAQWFAQSFRQQSLTQTRLADVLVSVDWLLPDGTIEVFGAFGHRDDQPLRSLAAQKLVPQLFELMNRSLAQQAAQQPIWPLHFHLEALADQSRVNLAHFFAGHAGSLGWLVAATFKKSERPVTLNPPGNMQQSQPDYLELSQAIKKVVDPQRVFLSLADQNG